MPSEPATPLHRRKACFTCIRAKRRCDKKLPSCQRCVERDSQCRYPTTRPYARQSRPSQDSILLTQHGGLSQALKDPIAPGPGENVDFEFSHLGSDWIDPDSWQLFGNLPDPFGLDNTNGSETQLVPKPPWYATPESWEIDMCDLGENRTCISVSALHGFIESLRGWVRQWLEQGHCSFIHRELYSDTGLPSCLQDAYATWAAYSGKNDANQEMVMQLVGDKADALIRHRETSRRQPSSAAQSDQVSYLPHAANIRDQLAHVQALIVYQLIRLFDGHIRQRANAEAHMPVLQTWRTQLWDLAKSSVASEPFATPDDYPSLPHTQRTGRLWRQWILVESIRRTWMVANYMHSVYVALRDGQGECPGSIHFTLRRGLWDAPNASSWSQLVESKNPLLMKSDSTSLVCRAARGSEVDDFARAVISIVWDTETIEAWEGGELWHGMT